MTDNITIVIFCSLLDMMLTEVSYKVKLIGESCDKTVEITVPSVSYVTT